MWREKNKDTHYSFSWCTTFPMVTGSLSHHDTGNAWLQQWPAQTVIGWLTCPLCQFRTRKPWKAKTPWLHIIFWIGKVSNTFYFIFLTHTDHIKLKRISLDNTFNFVKDLKIFCHLCFKYSTADSHDHNVLILDQYTWQSWIYLT